MTFIVNIHWRRPGVFKSCIEMSECEVMGVEGDVLTYSRAGFQRRGGRQRSQNMTSLQRNTEVHYSY